jgi:2-hydroxymuconate-semialdehyde hydrolase
VGFGYTERPADFTYTMDAWIQHFIGFLDAMKLDRVDLVGNSFGGSLAIAAAVRYPNRFRRIVLMGPVVVPFPITPGLDAVWGYEPTREAMARVMEYFAFDRSLITPDIVESRFNASLRPGYQDSFAAMFPAPRQRHVDSLATSEDRLKTLPHDVLIVHGREDQVIPVEASWRLAKILPRARLHIFSQCGHWTQIEKCEPFCRLVSDFLTEEKF